VLVTAQPKLEGSSQLGKVVARDSSLSVPVWLGKAYSGGGGRAVMRGD
jgi:hypothetical protein